MGHFPRHRERPGQQDGGRSSRTGVSTPTSAGREFRPSDSRGRPCIPAAPPPSPAARDGQATAIKGTKATSYQEGPTDHGDAHSGPPLTRSTPRAGKGEEKTRETSLITSPTAAERRSGYWTLCTEEPTGQYRKEQADTGGHLPAWEWDRRGPLGGALTQGVGREEGRAAGMRLQPPLPRGAEG